MNKDTLKGQWKQLKGQVRKQWGKFTDDDLIRSTGTPSSWQARFRSATGTRRTRAQREVDNFFNDQSQA